MQMKHSMKFAFGMRICSFIHTEQNKSGYILIETTVNFIFKDKKQKKKKVCLEKKIILSTLNLSYILFSIKF